MIKTADWIESNAKNCAQACVEGKNFSFSIKQLYNCRIKNKTNSENRHLVFLIFKKEQENDGVGDISS